MNETHLRQAVRRRVLAAGAASLLLGTGHVRAQPATILTRAIPRTGEMLPVIGLGTAIIFDIGSDAARRAERAAVLRTFVEGGARLIDTAPAYGSAESVLGDLTAELKLRERTFLATKFSARGRDGARAELQASQRRLRSEKIDLLQRWNVGFADPAEVADHLALAREWKAAGICRYLGVTHSQNQASANKRLIELLRTEKLDFIQINYSLAERSVEERLLAVARDTGTAVLVNLPFARARLFRAVQGKSVPDWAAEFDAATWGQFFLKYLLAHEAVNCVLPGTDKPEYMLDNLAAGHGRLPDAAMRRRMAEFVGALL